MIDRAQSRTLPSIIRALGVVAVALCACGGGDDDSGDSVNTVELALAPPNDMGSGVDAGGTFLTPTVPAVLSGTGRLGGDYGSGKDNDDFYLVSLEAGQTLTVTMTPPAASTFKLEIHDPDGTVLSVANGLPGATRTTVTKITHDGDYRVHVKRIEFGGFYTLNIDIAGAAWATAYVSNRDHGVGTNDSYFARPTKDGGIVFAGSTIGSDFGGGLFARNAWLTKVDAFGSPLWSKTYETVIGGSRLIKGESVVETSDGFAFLASAPGTSWSMVLRLDSNGAIQWQKAYQAGELNHIASTADGGFILSGVDNNGSNGDDGSVVKLASDGTVQWQAKYGGPGHDDAQYIGSTADGGYLFVGATGPSYATWLVKLTATGAIQWQKRYDSIIGGTHWHATLDGGYIIVGSGLTGAKVNANGDVVWARSYTSPGEPVSSARYSFHQMADGMLVLMGYTIGANAVFGNGNIYVMTLDGSGNILSQHQYPVGHHLQDPSIVMMPDGGFIVQSWVEDISWIWGSYSVVLLRLPMDGALAPLSLGANFTSQNIGCSPVQTSASRLAVSPLVSIPSVAPGDSLLLIRDLLANPPASGMAGWSYFP